MKTPEKENRSCKSIYLQKCYDSTGKTKINFAFNFLNVRLDVYDRSHLKHYLSHRSVAETLFVAPVPLRTTAKKKKKAQLSVCDWSDAPLCFD